MAISISQFVDLLIKKLEGVAKTDTETNKSPSNESIPSPMLNRGDTCWTEAISIPDVAVATPNLVVEHRFGNAIQCVADTTTVAVGGIFPTWLTNIPEWIPPEFGSTYSVQAYVGPPGAANIVATGTFISSAGQAGTGEWFFDYQAGLLNFIGQTIPASLTSGNVVYITGYSYAGLTGVTNLPSDTAIANIVFDNTTISSNSVGNLVSFGGNAGIVLPSGDNNQRPSNAVIGTTRFNTLSDSLETWDGADWITGGNTISPGTILDQQIIPDGVSTTYTLIQSATTTGVLVSINGINQIPDIAYTIANTNITFNQVPLTQDLIDIRFISYVTSISSLSNSSGNAYVDITPTGNISFATNGNVFSLMSSDTFEVNGDIVANGNITTNGYFIGNIVGNIVAPGANTQVIYNNNGAFAANSGFTFNPASNSLAVAGNITSNNINSGNILTSGEIISNGNITTSGYFIGNILGNISGNILAPGSNTQVIYNNNGNLAATSGFTFNSVSNALAVAGNITSGNISSGNITNGNILTSGEIIANGNITTSGYFIGNILGNISAPGSNTQVIYNDNGNLAATSGFVFDSALNALSVAGNVTSGNVLSGGDISATGNIAIGNVLSGGDISATGNVTSGNISATGNVTSANVNAVRLSGNLTTSIQSNITSVGTLTSLSVSGNLVSSNISATAIRATTIAAANIGNSLTQLFGADLNVGGYIIGNYYLGTMLTAAQTGITSLGDLTNLSVVGNVNVDGNINAANNLKIGNILNSTGNTIISIASGNIGFTTSNVTQATINSAGTFAISGQSLQLPTYTVTQALAIATPTAGEVIYVSNGDAGAPSLAVFDGATWKRVALGATISAT